MARPATWTMEVALDETGGTTRAQVRLAAAGGTSFLGIGLVRGGPRGVHLPEIAAELAMARAFSDLTEELLEAVASDIEAAAPGPVISVPARA
ncbi:dsRBD fold-containing protein [Amycolatopsis sp. GM8]|uniref:dsRBD fold-containing protein n=1 Tax=Amycolatopsis sp. GM8 TaxID=2896530 RepID=UPI001F36A70C|nr:dsRBD fold-containing protein [Amycolatopsis sp. GM8]